MKNLYILGLIICSGFNLNAQVANWITYPNGGEKIGLGTQIYVNLDMSVRSYTTVKVELYKGTSVVYGPVTLTYTNLEIPTSSLTPGTDYKIKITNPANASEYGISNNTFEIGYFTSLNYVTTNNVRIKDVTSPTSVDALSVDQKSAITEYSDKLGRNIQSVSWMASPSKKDVISATSYDKLGRSPVVYAPVVLDQTTGGFKPGLLASPTYAASAHYAFYNASGTLNTNIAFDASPYSKVLFDNSPLSRVAEQGSIGYTWQPDLPTVASDRKTQKFAYRSNASNEVVAFKAVQQSYTAISVTGVEFHPANTLSVTTITDDTNPDHLKSEVFSDQLGRKILERAQLTSSVWVSTYYVYDESGRLVTIIPPEAFSKMTIGTGEAPTGYQLLTQNTTITPGTNNKYCYKNNVTVTMAPTATWPSNTEIIKFPDAAMNIVTPLAQYGFFYTYDLEGRVVAKKSPGSDWEYFVYDKLGRLILKQNANQRTSNQWLFTKFDYTGRMILSGLVTITDPVETIQTNAQNSSVLFETPGSIVHGYTNNAFPNVSDPNQYLRVNYYDDYSFKSAIGNSTYDYNGAHVSGLPVAEFLRCRGLLTGSKRKALEQNNWVWDVAYYDDNLRMIQTISGNFMTGTDRSSTVYDFSGLVLSEGTSHTTSSANINTVITYQYDHAGRLKRVYNQINQQAPILQAEYVYNQLGQIIDKKLHSIDAGAHWMQSVDLSYNIKGSVTSVNNVATSSPDNDYYSMATYFDGQAPYSGGNTPRFDGLISATAWRSDQTNKYNLYNYTYDGLGRLTNSQYRKNAVSSWAKENKFNEGPISYDYNGNIKSLTRNNGGPIDQLSYDYGSGGNQLRNVSDTQGTTGFKDGANDPNEYQYDAVGNLIVDQNKGITQITYNVLNLPKRVTFSDNSYVAYEYDASGQKLAQILVNDVGQSTRTDYVGAYVYTNSVFSYASTSFGRITPPSFYNMVLNREGNLTGNVEVCAKVSGACYINITNLTRETINGGNYLKLTKATWGTSYSYYGITNIEQNHSFYVKEGQTYKYQVKGYSASSNVPYLLVTGSNGSIIAFNTVSLPVGQANDGWVTQEFTIPAGVTTIYLGVAWSTATTDADAFYIDKFSLYQTDYQYLYDLIDQVGSTRVVLNADPQQLQFVNTFETENADEEDPKFLNVDRSKVVTHVLANSTPYGGSKVIRMDNAYRIGPSRSIKVFPGDYVQAKVTAYYETTSGYNEALTSAVTTALINVMSGGSQGIIDGINTAYANSNGSNSALTLSPNLGSAQPSAFLNYILFDEDFQVLEAKSVPVGSTANSKQTISTPQLLIQELGILFIYLSYDNENTIPVYFDDFTINHSESNLVQVNNYYPYGMISTSWVRDQHLDSNAKYQGKEYDNKTGWYDFHARQYDAALGKWFNVDPKNQFASAYVGMGNNPVVYVDPDGQWVHIAIGAAAGAIFNVASNWKNIKNPGDFGKYFGIGAVAGAAGAATGQYALAGAIIGGGNTWVQGGDATQIMMGTSIGAISGAIGGVAGGAVGQNLGGFAQGFVQGAVGGGTGGFVGGFLMSAYDTGDLGQAFRAGVKGGVIGGLTGGIAGGILNGLGAAFPTKKSGQDPHNFWSGNKIAAGRGRFALNNSARYSITFGKPVLTPTQPADGWDFTYNKTLYRGTTGSEKGSGPLFLTDDALYAAGYVRNGGQVVKVEIPIQTFQELQSQGLIQPYRGINNSNGMMGNEFVIYNLQLKQTIVELFKVHN